MAAVVPARPVQGASRPRRPMRPPAMAHPRRHRLRLADPAAAFPAGTAAPPPRARPKARTATPPRRAQPKAEASRPRRPRIPPAGGPASALTQADVGHRGVSGLIPIEPGQAASYAVMSPPAALAFGAMSAGYGGSGESLTYTAEADFSSVSPGTWDYYV